jgi:hypothetical protein
VTRTANARIAGVTFLGYIALGIAAMTLSGRATGGQGGGIAAQLAALAQHATDARIAAVLNLGCAFAAVVLGVTLYTLTRDQDGDLAMLGLICRVAEGLVGAVSIQGSLGLLWLATAAGAKTVNPEAAQALGTFLLDGQAWGVSAIFFAVGSTLFSWLFLRGRMIPVGLAWLGVLASVLLVVTLPLQLVGVLHGTVTQLIWIPMAAFEIPLALWLIIKGVAK